MLSPGARVWLLNKARHTGVFLNTKLDEAPGRETVFRLSLTHTFLFISHPGSAELLRKARCSWEDIPKQAMKRRSRAAPALLAQCQLIFWNHSSPRLGKPLIPLLSLCSFVSIQEL